MVLAREKVESGMRSAKIQVRPGAEGALGGGGRGGPEVRWMGWWWACGPAVAGEEQRTARGLRSNRQPSVTNEHADEGEEGT